MIALRASRPGPSRVDNLRVSAKSFLRKHPPTCLLVPRYDLKAFNDTAVLGGNVPLDVLARRVDEYLRM